MSQDASAWDVVVVVCLMLLHQSMHDLLGVTNLNSMLCHDFLWLIDESKQLIESSCLI